MARHRAAIKERLIDAIENGISRLRPNERELNKMPPELREEFSSLMNGLTKIRRRSERKTALHATVEVITEREAQMMVDRILALCDAIEHLPRGEKEFD